MKAFLLVLFVFVLNGVFGLRAQQKINGPGDTIIGGQILGGVFVQATEGTPAGNANMFPSDGKPSFAIDENRLTKYRNFGEFNTGFVITPGANYGNGGTGVTQLVFGTANDSPERDPLTFTLEGTTGNPLTGTYTLITSGSTGFDVDPGRQAAVVGPAFPAVGAFTSYRIIFPTIRNPATADSMQIGEVALIGYAAPEPTTLSLLMLSALGLLGARGKRVVKE